MNYQSKKQLEKTFNLTATEVQKIIESNCVQAAYTNAQETYFEIESVEGHIKDYLEKKEKLISVKEIEEIYKLSKYSIRALINENQIKPIYQVARKQFYNIDEIDFFIQQNNEKAMYFKSLFVISKEFEIGDDLTTKRILTFNDINYSFKKGKAQYYDIRQVKHLLQAYQRSKTLHDLVNIYNLKVESLKKLIAKFNIRPIYTSENGYISYYDFSQIQPLFDKYFNELSEAKEKYKNLSQISKDHNISYNTLVRIINRSNIEPKFISHSNIRFFDEEEVIHAFQRSTIEKVYVNANRQISSYDKLHVDLQQKIDEYLQFRESGMTIRSRIYKTKKRNIAHANKNLKSIKSRISSVLFKIGAARNNVQQDSTEPIYFDIYSLNQQDILILRQLFSNSTLVSTYTIILPFLSYLLEIERKKALLTNEITKYSLIEMNFEDFLNQFPLNLEDGDKPPVEKIKAFLTREQCIDVYNLLLSNPRSSFPLKNATMWLICTTMGIRPEEILLLRIEDFLLDENGFLTTNDFNWGVLNVRKEASKGEKSPSSHRECKTPIPFTVVNLINNYLTWLYQKQGRHVARGRGYLFRTHIQNVESRLKASSNQAINQITPFLNFLTPDQKKDFEFKAGRRSLNTFFVKAIDVVPEILGNWKLEKARQHQMRHSGDGYTHSLTKVQQAKTGSRHYTEDISAEDYYAVLEYIITFPWNKKELILWEIEKGYRNLDNEVLNIDFKDDAEKTNFATFINDETKKKQLLQNKVKQQEESRFDKLTEQLHSIENELHAMKEAPLADTDFEKWLKARASLLNRKKEILAYLEKNN